MILQELYTVSASKQARGSIFQNGFLGGAQFNIVLKKWGFIQENPPKT